MASGAATGAVAAGRFITFEGGEGAGKSTQARLLFERLAAVSIDSVLTREPGGAPGAEEIRRLLVHGAPERWRPMTEALLHSAARCEHVAITIRPALAAGRWVVSDRFADSTMAYQGYGQGLGRETVASLSALVLGDFRPDLTLILDLPARDGLARARARAEEAGAEGGETRYERMDLAMHERLRQGFLDIAEHAPERCAVIDARGDVARVSAAVGAVVADRLGVALP